jgi:beta-ureidopropionase / N-carbamoyl-L-amino-acid hydrolase
MITAEKLDELLTDLIPIGLDEDGGTTRLTWTREDEEAAGWFARRAAAIGRRMERDPAGNLWAIPDVPGPWWAAGSHLDSVRAGGRFDGALGVAAAFAVAEHAPIAVISFADEEGARFNTPTFGSRALVGRLDAADVLARTDDDGVTLRDAMAAAGVDPGGLARAPEWLSRLRGFLELHIDQTRDLETAGRPAGVVSGLASRVRLQADLHGRADHAGTTRRHERSDALLRAAILIVAAHQRATEDMVVTASRMLVEPNALTTIASHVRLWLDARSENPSALTAWFQDLPDGAELSVAARSDGVEFDRALRAALGDAEGVMCFAGHDAGILASKIPAAMVLSRNPSGVSHSPEEEADLDDAAAAATAILEVVQ